MDQSLIPDYFYYADPLIYSQETSVLRFSEMKSVGEQRCSINTDLHMPDVHCTSHGCNARSMHRASARICTIMEIAWNWMSWILYLVIGVCIWLCLMQASVKDVVFGACAWCIWCLCLVLVLCVWRLCLVIVLGVWCLCLMNAHSFLQVPMSYLSQILEAIYSYAFKHYRIYISNKSSRTFLRELCVSLVYRYVYRWALYFQGRGEIENLHLHCIRYAGSMRCNALMTIIASKSPQLSSCRNQLQSIGYYILMMKFARRSGQHLLSALIRLIINFQEFPQVLFIYGFDNEIFYPALYAGTDMMKMIFLRCDFAVYIWAKGIGQAWS